jgi:hypothetical protein
MPKLLKLIIFLLVFSFSVNFVAASEPILPVPTGPLPAASACDPKTQNCGNYALNDFIKIAANVAKFIEGIIGSLALLMFVYGGILMIISAGSSEKVTKARGVLVGAVIGLAIFFASYLLIGFILVKAGLVVEGRETRWATTDFVNDW